MNAFVEQNCTFTHEGKEFTAHGASACGDRLFAYLGKDARLTDWHGNSIGTYIITSTWKTPRSHVSSTMHQVWARVAGVTYTGRSAGVGMSFSGRRSEARR